ncbi:MAG: cysteine desulfurase [Clostridiales bacterium]|nr:cysteine desulfurase [Clostridiales bacterium]
MSNRIIDDFPALTQEINGKRLVYLDSAATSQKPISVISAVENYYKYSNANAHRGAYTLAMKATQAYEDARTVVKNFIGAHSEKEIIFTKSATEGFNIIAYTYGMKYINEGDEILISIAEHHSNLIPWQQLAKLKNANLNYMYLNEDGIISDEEIEHKITAKTKLVSVTQVSNALGTVQPVEKIIQRAHEVGAVVIVDGAQSVPHQKVNVSDLDADFLVFSGHKMLGPMGIGVLYGKEELLNDMPPFLYGGDMIEYVTEQDSTFAQLPYKFEGGTQNIGGAIGLAAAIDYLEKFGLDKIVAIEKELIGYAIDKLSNVPHVTLYGSRNIENKSGVLSFNIEEVHPHDVATILDSYGVAIRAGHHSAQPLMKYMKVNATCRASVYMYNNKEDIDILAEALGNTRRWLGFGA